MAAQGKTSGGMGGGRRTRASGFTLVEVVCVLVVVGILAVFVGNHLLNNNRAIAEADALKAALRYAQTRAMADVYTWGIRFSAGSYTLVGNNPNVTALLPYQSTATRTLSSGVQISTSGLTSSTIYFDWRGQPVTAAITAIGGTSTPATGYQTVTVTERSGVTVTVTPYTGFIP